MKTLSIITVCYNSEKVIKKCIDSIVYQLTDDVEYIIVDGKSKDNTMPIVRQYKNIKWISEPDDGIYDAMNKGIKMCDGKYIQFINSDDSLQTDILKKMVPILKTSKYDVIYGDTLFVMERENKKYAKKVVGIENLKRLDRRTIFCHQSTFTRKEMLEKIGLFDIKYAIAADWDSFVKIRNAGGTFKHIEENVSQFSINGVSSTKTHLLERKKIRKANKIYKYVDIYFVMDIIDVILIKSKKLFKSLGLDIDKYYIKRGIFKNIE